MRNDLIKDIRGLALACMNFSEREGMCLYISYQTTPDLFISIIPVTWHVKLALFFNFTLQWHATLFLILSRWKGWFPKVLCKELKGWLFFNNRVQFLVHLSFGAQFVMEARRKWVFLNFVVILRNVSSEQDNNMVLSLSKSRLWGFSSLFWPQINFLSWTYSKHLNCIHSKR